MALPMDDPYRGYAAVTHDTNRIAEVIEELNTFRSDVTASDTAQNTNLTNHAAGNGHSGIYAPSAQQYWAESANGDGTGVVQTISNNTTTLLDLGAATNNGGGYSAGSDTYTVPATGMYATQLIVRAADSLGVSGNIGLHVHVNSTHGYYTQWFQYVNGAGSRFTAECLRVASWNSSDALKAYLYQDTGFAMNITMIYFAAWRLG
jgi:hypothetical protein